MPGLVATWGGATGEDTLDRAPIGKVLLLQMGCWPPLPVRNLTCREGNSKILQGDHPLRWPRTVGFMSECPNLFMNNALLIYQSVLVWMVHFMVVSGLQLDHQLGVRRGLEEHEGEWGEVEV